MIDLNIFNYKNQNLVLAALLGNLMIKLLYVWMKGSQFLAEYWTAALYYRNLPPNLLSLKWICSK